MTGLDLLAALVLSPLGLVVTGLGLGTAVVVDYLERDA